MQKRIELKKFISIDVYSDTICPWCYIGFYELKETIKLFSNISFDIVWRPFQLNPMMPLDGMDRQEYLEMKFGSKKKGKEIYSKIYEAGLKSNIHFQFEKIKKTPNSFSSHKLLALAYKFKKQSEVLETLFYSFFIEGIDIGNHQELVNIAKHHEIFDNSTLEYFQSEEDNINLLQEQKQATELKIKGVPCFIINKEFVLFGVQSKKTLLSLFQDMQKK